MKSHNNNNKLLFWLVTALAATEAFVPQRSSRAFVSRPHYMAQGAFENDRADLRKAVQDAQRAIDNSARILNNVNTNMETIASAMGGAALGAATDVFLASAGGGDGIPPEAVAAAAAGAALIAASQEDEIIGPATRTLLGKPVIHVGKSIWKAGQSLVTMLVRRIQALPEQLAQAAQQQTKRTIQEIQSIPAKLLAWMQRKAQETAQNVETEIKMAPGRFMEHVKMQIENGLKAPEQAWKEWQEQTVWSMIRDNNSNTNKPPMSKATFFMPQPPKTPPPMSLFA